MKTKMKKDWFGREKSVDELHHDSKIWVSEINLIKDEIRFLEHLLSANYIDFLVAGLHKKIEDSVKQISVQKNIGTTLLDVINSQNKILAKLIKYESVSGNKNYLESHKQLEIEVTNYIHKYKELKQRIFKAVENVMKKKDQKKLSGTYEIPKLMDK
ncbi:MAG: hypothetical protein APF83_07680 [Lutibacter sp. BRH_c52]|nr:MAG: hypothetical protein APF83_07680 [Lutibacter sp. BRH_c52]